MHGVIRADQVPVGINGANRHVNAVPAVLSRGCTARACRRARGRGLTGHQNLEFRDAPPLTVMLGLVLAVLVPSLASVAVTVAVPPVVKVTLNV